MGSCQSSRVCLVMASEAAWLCYLSSDGLCLWLASSCAETIYGNSIREFVNIPDTLGVRPQLRTLSVSALLPADGDGEAGAYEPGAASYFLQRSASVCRNACKSVSLEALSNGIEAAS